MALELEKEVYKRHFAEMLADGENEGKFAVVHRQEVLGPFDSYEAALTEGYQRFGLEDFLVKRICRVEPVYYFTRDLD